MLNKISYNIVIDRFRAFADGHYLIRRFSHGQVDVTDIIKDNEYPWMHVVPVSMTPSDGSMAYEFDVIFADLPRDKESPTEYQRESLSDCVRLAEDLIAEIKNGGVIFGQDVTLDTGTTIEPFIEEYTHTLTGVNCKLSMTFPNNWSACDIPADWSIGGSGSGGAGNERVSIVLRTNSTDNAIQTILDLTAGANMTITDLGDGRVQFDATGDIGTTWGTIGGLLADQVDLQNALDLKADIASLAAVAFSGDYNDLTNLPTIPSAQVNSDWNAVSGVAEILNKPSLATVATSGSYNDLSDKPTIPPAQVNSDWNAVSGVSQILNKPTIPTLLDDLTDVNTAGEEMRNVLLYNGSVWVPYMLADVAYSGNYYDLVNRPTIPKTLADLITGTAPKQLLQWNGTTWVTISGLNIGDLLNVNGVPTNGQVLTYDSATSKWIPATPTTSSGTVTSVGVSVPSAFNVSGTPVTTSGTIAISGAGTSAQYVDGTGALQTMPTGLPPTGIAGGDLTGTYPNPTVHAVHGIDFQNGTPTANDVFVYGGSPAKWQHQHVNAGIVDNDSAVTGTTVKDALNHLNTTKVEANATITAGTATKITYDTKGLVTAGTTLSASDIPSGVDAAKIGSGVVSNTEFGYLDGVTSALQTQIDGKQSTLVSGTNVKTIEGQSILGTGNIDLTKSDVGLANVDNTSDLSKPISTATQTALNAKQDTLVSGTSIKTVNATSLLGSGDVAVQATLISGTNIKTIEGQSLLGSGNIDLTKSDVGLSNVDNTSDLNKPISTATQTALNGKVDTTRTISTTSPLSGGGDLSANRTLSIANAAADGTTKGAATFTAADFNDNGTGVISLDYTNGQKANASQPGFISAADWSTFNSKPSSDSIIFSSNQNSSQGAGATSYWAVVAGGAPATEAERQVIMPCSGTLKNFYIRNRTAQSTGGSLVFTVRKNGADTSITATFVNADGAAVTKSDTTNTVSVAAGDLITVKGVNNAAASASAIIVGMSIILER